MLRQERAKQFMPFDAMKGLQEALREREEKHSRTPRREISQEQVEQNCAVLRRVRRGTMCCAEHYCMCHDVFDMGEVAEINLPSGYIKLNGRQIYFEDIYNIEIV